MDDPLRISILICDDHRRYISFLSNNPEMSFVTKDHFIWELLFS
jgi:hypothetical protein